MAVVSAGSGASILIRGSIGELGKATNWTNLFPVVRQDGGGMFCEPLVPAPEEWADMEGVVQVIESGEEGLSYQVGALFLYFSYSYHIISYSLFQTWPHRFILLVRNSSCACLMAFYIYIYILHRLITTQLTPPPSAPPSSSAPPAAAAPSQRSAATAPT